MRKGPRVIIWTTVAALLAAFGLALLLARSLFAVQAQSFDTLLYARGLSGLARGDAYNPVAGTSTLAVHGHFGLLVLAPLARLLPAAAVLIMAQAAAFGATVGLTVGALARRAAESTDRSTSSVAVVSLGLVLFACSPLVVNPFLFDARPDLVAVPLVLGGLIRWDRRGRLDGAAAGLILGACLIREEFAMAAVGAFMLAPLPWRGRDTWLRLAGSATAIAYWGWYWTVGREWLGGPVAVERVSDAGAVLLGSSADGLVAAWWAAWPYKLEIVGAALGTLGGAALLGWRWLGVALPGLMLLLVMNRRADQVILLHYAMFATPGLLMAGVAGARRVLGWAGPSAKARRLGCVFASVGVAGTLFAMSSALPLGGRHQRDYFLLDGDQAELLPFASSRSLLSFVPPGAGLAVPYMIGAAEADRVVVIPTSRYAELARAPREPLASIGWVALLPDDWETLGRALVQLDDFSLLGSTPWLALLRRRGEGRELAVPPGVTAQQCEQPLGLWPAAGLAVCRPSRDSTGRLQISVTRAGPTNEALSAEPLGLTLVHGDQLIAMTIFHGLVALRDLSPGQTVLAVADEPSQRASELRLIHPDGTPVPMAIPDGRGGARPSLGVTLDVDR